MSDVQLYLVEAGKNKEAASSIAQDVARKLETKQLQLLTLIESVGDYINNEDAQLRTQSISFLAEVLEALPPRTLSLQQRSLLTEFVLTRIQDDSDGVGPCARALMALERLGKWDGETAKKIISTLIDSNHTLKDFKLQGERYTILQLIDVLLAKYRTPINERVDGDFKFIDKFVSYFEGEKDPRNLMIAFSIVQVPMTEWDLGPSTQDLFELVFNYFPITFKPPPGDPFKITAQDLKDRLKSCIASTSAFAPYSFPALLDKLDSSSMNTKRDVLQALTACIESYEPRNISLYSVTLWDALKFEILNVQEEDLADSALQALASIARQLLLASEGALHNYLKPIIKECNEHLEDAPTKQSEAAAQILKSIISTYPLVADYVVRGITPVLISLFQSSESIAKRRGLIEVLNRLLEAILDVSAMWQVRNEDGDITSDHASNQALREFSETLVSMLLLVVTSAPKTEVAFRLVSMRGLELMLRIRSLVTEADAARILSDATEIVLREVEGNSDDIKAAAIKIITAAAQNFPKASIERALPALVAELPDCPEPGIFTYEPALEALAKLSIESQLADTIILRLKNKINIAKRQSAPRTYLLGLLTALLFIFTNGSPGRENGSIKIEYLRDLALPLIEEALGLATAESQLLSSEVTINILGRICMIILRDQSLHVQNQIYTSVERLFSTLHASQPTPEAERQQKTGSKLGVLASMYLHAGFRAEIYQDEVPEQLLTSLFDIAHEKGNTRMIHASLLRHITIVIDKFVPAAAMQVVLEKSQPAILTLSAESSSADIEIALAVVKGLVVSGKSVKLASSSLRTLLSLHSSEQIGTSAATEIAQILAQDELLVKDNHCQISGLHKQRTYNLCTQVICSDFKTATPTTKHNYLITLSGLLKSLPYDIVQPSLPSITPLLLQSLELEGTALQKVQASALVTIEAVLLYDSAILNEHTSTLVRRMLDCGNPEKHHEDVRVAALKCLKLLPAQLKRETVIPFRRQVTAKLVTSLDDRKRTVRAEAVRARTAWLGLDQEDEDTG